ncbi:Mu-like prophage major head subunit gpT family protein [Thalassobaculum sp.]|uniref:Mu-like prophage major head subunit gpT family protein n=1 Tax=Thalassobaculum sp. TaxID=2022740 RepID=UPI0032EBE9F7
MGAEVLSSRAVIGGFYNSLEATRNVGIGLALGAVFNSDQPSEEYPWLGAVPKLTEWAGGRLVSNLRNFGWTVQNREYQSSVEFKVKDLRRDKTGQVMARIGELAKSTNLHWDELVAALMEAGETAVCYDGQYYFDTDHSAGDSGTQSNLLSVDISALAVSVHGSTTAPSVQEAAQVILRIVSAILAFKDDRGRPINRDATKFVIAVPTSLFAVYAQAASAATFGSGESNPVAALPGFEISVRMVPELSWTASVAGFRADGMAHRPFILQEETGAILSVLGEGSDYAHLKKAHLYSVDASRAAAYGVWEHACKATMV